jgi:DNA (cytosine-5)-methyltransferase 1
MRIGSLFSGAAGLDLAALDLFPGSSVVWHCEIEPAACKVLAHHWPAVPNLGNIERIGLDFSDAEWALIEKARAIANEHPEQILPLQIPPPDWSGVEPVDVLTGGFPCQDVSLAGARRGLGEGTRSGLWSHMATAIDVLRPQFVLIENVRGLLSAEAFRDMESGPDDLGDGGVRPILRALGAVLGDLADLGFDAEWTMLRASDIGFCHHRARVFILAYPADSSCDGREGRPESDGQPQVGFQRSLGRDAYRRGDHAVTLLPTPQVADVTGGHRTRSGARSNELLLPGLAEAYAAGSLLPTPRASDGTKGGPNQRGSSGDLMLPSAVMSLLPTTDANGPGAHGTGGPDLRTAVCQWGDYAPAIRRQESLTRPVPSPTEPNTKGNQRLSAHFAQWMMGWPSGWVTDPALGISRADQLKAIGNGVVPQQAVAAFSQLLAAIGAPIEGATP